VLRVRARVPAETIGVPAAFWLLRIRVTLWA
jgi:hypothetical protein